jgi:drug/metabolite transporter (DMT)-like permease
VTVQRGVATVVLASLALALTRGPLRVSARLAVSVALIAVLEVAAAVPVLIALQRGPVAVATVTASLYPVASVVLAAVVLRERLSRVQYLGVLCALVSVALVSTG